LLAYITAKNLKENERLFVFPKTKGLVNTDVKENRVLEYMSATQQKNIARWMLRKTGEELGYEKLHPHMFRHSLGFNLRQQGWRMEDIQVVLGHSSISTTGIYATADNKKIHEEFEKTIK
jgi:site-specific recombinase XerD